MTIIQLKRGTAQEWLDANPVLEAGEAGFEIDTASLKIGDGTTAWNGLPYVASSSASTPFVDYLGTEGNNDVTITGLETETVVDSFDANTWRTVKYYLSLSSASTNKFHSTELNILVESDGVSVSEHSAIDSNGEVGTINVSRSGATVNVSVVPGLLTKPITARFYRTGLKA